MRHPIPVGGHSRGPRAWGTAALAAALVPIMISAGCRKGTPAAELLHTPFSVTDDAGNAREYRLYLPGKKGRVPLMLYFHGVISPGFKNIPSLRDYTGSPVEETGLIAFCRERGIALLVPEALY